MLATDDKLLSVFRILTTCLIVVNASYFTYQISTRQFRRTTLDTAVNWSAIAMFVCTVVWFVDPVFGLVRRGVADLLWYLVSVLILCPPIAVLGAKRPGVRVWNIFILIPLLLVFLWPAMADGPAAIRNGEFKIQTPMIVAYFLVLIMGAGNYLGTRWTIDALGCIFGCVLLIGRSTVFAENDVHHVALSAALCSLTVTAASAHTKLQFNLQTGRLRPLNRPNGFDRVWLDFRDWFGIVWSRRVQERINDTAEKENWSARLEHHGFVWTDEVTEQQTAETNARIDHTMRWLLRRFVDDQWIDERLQQQPAEDSDSTD